MRDLVDDLLVAWPAAAHLIEIRLDILRPDRRPVGQEQYGRVHGRNSRTISTTAFTFSTGVSGRIPCPRLKICPGRAPVRFSRSVTCSFNSAIGANRMVGSKLPWIAER